MVARKQVTIIKAKDVGGQLFDSIGVLANDVGQSALRDHRLDLGMKPHGIWTILVREKKSIAIL